MKNQGFQFANKKNVHDLQIRASQIIDVSNSHLTSLAGLPSPNIIKNLLASNNNIEIIEEEQLRYCKSIVNLDLSSNQISKIENLFYLTHLHVLNLSKNLITVLENLEGNTNLRQLDVSDNQISSIFIRSPLPKLVILDLSGNKIRRLLGLNSFPCLSTLKIERCQLISLSGLQQLLNLRRICASSNSISNFPPFYLPLLSHIDVSLNSLTSLTPFGQFQSLVRLDISQNPISDEGLQINTVFNEMKEFRANYTNISDPSLIANFAPNIVVISITSSKITSIEKVQLLIQKLPSLKSIDTRNNPINSDIYPDVNNVNNRNEEKNFPEYENEEEYYKLYPEKENEIRKYRNTILGTNSLGIAILDGIGINGTSKDAKFTFSFIEESQIESFIESQFVEPVQQQNKETNTQNEFEIFNEPHYIEKGMQTDFNNEFIDNGIQNDLIHNEISNNQSYSNSEVLCESGDLFDIGEIQSNSSTINYDIDKFSAATDLDDELFNKINVRNNFSKVNKNQKLHPENPKLQTYDDDIIRNRGGCSFWVPLDVKPKRKSRTQNLNNEYKQKPKHLGISYPFNTKSERRLPWDKETEQKKTMHPTKRFHARKTYFN